MCVCVCVCVCVCFIQYDRDFVTACCIVDIFKSAY